MMTGPTGGFASTGPEARTYTRDKDGKFSGTGSGKGPEQLHDDEATIRATFSYEDPQTGMRAEVEAIRNNGPHSTTYVQITITDRDGRPVGGAEREIRPADQYTVNHGGLALESGVRGQGFATRYNAHVEAAYREHGIRRVTLNANMDVGGYAWARAGYDFAGHRGSVEAHALVHGIKNPGLKAEIDRVVQNPHSTPADFAMIGHTPGATMWPGKEIMLGSNWDGVKLLDES